MEEFGAPDSLTNADLSNVSKTGMQEITNVHVLEELAVLVERAERPSKTTARLVRDFSFILYGTDRVLARD